MKVENTQVQMRKGILEFCILEIIGRGEAYASNMIVHIEEDGYEVLRNYLESIKNYFSGYTGNQEIIADIESRMAEIFYATLSPAKQVITLEDVEALIRKMGSVSDFAQIDEEENE